MDNMCLALHTSKESVYVLQNVQEYINKIKESYQQFFGEIHLQNQFCPQFIA